MDSTRHKIVLCTPTKPDILKATTHVGPRFFRTLENLYSIAITGSAGS